MERSKNDITGNYILIGDWQIIKSYKTFKEAMWDLGFYQLMYSDVRIYQLAVQNEEIVQLPK